MYKVNGSGQKKSHGLSAHFIAERLSVRLLILQCVLGWQGVALTSVPL